MADIFQIIEYEGDNNTFIFKSHIEDFNTGSQLIVNESQEAVFFMNGQALDLFGPGRHTLETQNIPLIRKFLNTPTDDKTPFRCKVYFINKTEQMAIKWGTDSKLEYRDPTYEFDFYPKIGASGVMSLRVEDSRKLLVKLVGTEARLSNDEFTQKMIEFLRTGIKTHLVALIKRDKINIFEMDEHLVSMSNTLHELFKPEFADYGIALERFAINAIKKPEDDPKYKDLRDRSIRRSNTLYEQETHKQEGIINSTGKAERMVIESQGEALKRKQEGYTYQEERAYDAVNNIAKNEAIGNFTNTGIGLGMMGGMAGGMGAVVAGITTDALNPVTAQHGATRSSSSPSVLGIGITMPPSIDLKSETPTEVPAPLQQSSGDMNEFKQKLEKLKMMKDMSMITDSEYEEERKRILNSL